jgi:ribonucleoside-diphosphate reductase alpha chain
LKDGPDGAQVADHVKLKRTITTAVRMLDNVIDINHFTLVKKSAADSSMRRPVGLIMGSRLPGANSRTVRLTGGGRVHDTSMEMLRLWASAELAGNAVAGMRAKGSLWTKAFA